jgi:hypothetical protein
LGTRAIHFATTKKGEKGSDEVERDEMTKRIICKRQLLEKGEERAAKCDGNKTTKGTV